MSPSPTRLRVLHLEDDPGDVALVRATIEADGLICEWAHAATRAEFVTALAAPLDLILSDFALPGFDGISAQTLATELVPDAPFVFVSGTMGEEVAIERMKAGATDYVLKQRLTRLAPAVRRALQEAADRRQRADAEAEVRRLNDELEGRVAERTAQLRTANTFLDSIVENLPDMVSVKDARTLRFIRVNRAGERLLGLDRRELLGRTVEDVLPPTLSRAMSATDQEALGGRDVLDLPEEILATRHGAVRVLHTKKIPVADEEGQPQYLLGISEDITDKRFAAEETRIAKLEAERANRAKSDFLSRMSHDLRTPLNAILGFAQILELDGLALEQADSVRQILKGGRHLLELINEVLDITRIESGHLSLSPEPVRLDEVIGQVLDLLQPLAAARGITLRIEIEPGCPAYVHADRQRLTQVLVNLVGNAVKYNREQGRVLITGTPAPGERVLVRVADSGAGIPPEKLALVFDPFERLGAETSGVEGTGLGLAVAKGLMQAMHGTIGVESMIDRGTTFWIELPEGAPIETAEAVMPVVPGASDLDAAGTILYIEDNQPNVRLLERVLGRRRSVRLITAACGVEGLDRVQRERPDLVLLDLHLPDLPGEEVLRRLWENVGTRDIPVAVLSADATPSQRHRLLASGAVAYLTKPINVLELLSLIDARLAGSLRS